MPTHTTIKHKFAPYIKKTLAEFNGLNIGQKGERGHDMSAKHGPEPSLNSLFTKPLENSPPLYLHTHQDIMGPKLDWRENWSN